MLDGNRNYEGGAIPIYSGQAGVVGCYIGQRFRLLIAIGSNMQMRSHSGKYCSS